MDPLTMIARQTSDAYEWVNKLVAPVPYEQWDTTPAVMDTNITWQVGHLIMSFYFHSIMVIKGHQAVVLRTIPMKEYDAFFTKASPHHVVGKINPTHLHEHLLFMQQQSMEVINVLSPANLDSPLEPTPMKHPIAHTKWESLDWNIKHTLWHCGQIGMLKRVVDKRHDFGLGGD